MNRIRSLAEAITVIIISSLLTTGCGTSGDTATGSLWETKWYHPSPKPNVQLSQTPAHDDVLVQYDELYEDSKQPQRRAYWLLAEEGKIKGSKPRFVDPARFRDLTPVLVVDASAPNKLAADFCAVITGPATFEVWRNGAWLGSFELPDYYAAPRATGWRIVATPFVVLADGTVIVIVVAVVAGLVLGYIWLQSGAPIPAH